MRKIATRAKVSTGMLTYYYGAKRKMIIAAFMAASDGFQQQVYEKGGHTDGLRRLKAVFNVSFGDRPSTIPPWSFWLESWAHATRDQEMRQYHSLRFRLGRESFVRHLDAAAQQGQLREDIDTQAAAEVLFALYTGLGVHSAVEGQAQAFKPERAEELSNFLLSLYMNKEALEAQTEAQEEGITSDRV